jgi:hypothetical protein
LKVERFFHIRRYHPNGGATVRVVGDTDNPGQVAVQYAICSRKDNYCKRTGRELAATRTPKIIPLRNLPRELTDITAKAAIITNSPLPRIDYGYTLRYFLPKELA